MGVEEVRPPSAFRRGLVALALLVGFYAVTLGLAVGLVAASAGFIWLQWHHKAAVSAQVDLVLIAITWVPAVVLVRALFFRVSDEVLGTRIDRGEAPALFAMLEELAAKAGTRPPDDVYIVANARVGVTERGGFLGFGSRRLLLLGTPSLVTLEVSELRSILAHEMGHYLGGDTRLLGVATYTHAVFVSLLAAGARPVTDKSFVGGAGHAAARSISLLVGKTYARFYGLVTRRTGRRLELAADALAARLVGRDAMMRALEKSHLVFDLHAAYLAFTLGEVRRYLALPSDLLAGFAQFRAHLEKGGVTEKIEAAHRNAKTAPLDTHPALGERLDHLMPFPAGPPEDRRPASELFDAAALERWTVTAAQTLLVSPEKVRVMPWAQFATEAYAVTHRRQCEVLVGKLGVHPNAAHTFAFFVEELAQGRAIALLTHIAPSLRRLAPFDLKRVTPPIIADMLGDLFVGALLERGGRIRLELGEGSFFVDHAGRTVRPLVVAAAAKDATSALEHLREWAVILTQ